jgi:hypothetical protein
LNRRAGAVSATVAFLVVAACTGGSDDTPKPTTTVPPPSSSTSFTIVTVPGNPRTSTTLAAEIGPGEATIVGTVAGPDGPIPEAVVRVEHLIGDAVASVDVRSIGGSWQLPAVGGGRYRVRAWRSPDFAMLEPETFFLGATETKQITLVLTKFGELSVIASSDPSPLTVGQPGALITQVAAAAVNPQGVVKANPRPGVPVQLASGVGLTLDGSDKQVTDGEGRNAWRVRCLGPEGPPSAALLVGTARFAVNLPPCKPT